MNLKNPTEAGLVQNIQKREGPVLELYVDFIMWDMSDHFGLQTQ